MASPTLVGARDLARLNNFIAPAGSTFNKMILYLTKGGKMYHPLYLTKGGKKTRRMKIPSFGRTIRSTILSSPI